MLDLCINLIFSFLNFIVIHRVALTPAAAATLFKKGFSVNVEDGAGLESRFLNEDYAGAGAKVVDKNTAFHSGYNIQCSSSCGL
jgi:NAD/NADP transhydrogenase alpha subunit